MGDRMIEHPTPARVKALVLICISSRPSQPQPIAPIHPTVQDQFAEYLEAARAAFSAASSLSLIIIAAWIYSKLRFAASAQVAHAIAQ